MDKKYKLGRQRAITDSGSSSLILPRAQLDELASALGARRRTHGGVLMMPCKARFSLRLKIAGRTFPLDQRHLLLQKSAPGLCQLALAAGDFDFWILGAPFIRAYCQVHDFQRRRVGFALSRVD